MLSLCKKPLKHSAAVVSIIASSWQNIYILNTCVLFLLKEIKKTSLLCFHFFLLTLSSPAFWKVKGSCSVRKAA
jgi:hypothetical protein